MKFKTPIFLIFSFSIIFSIDYQTQIQPIFSQYCTGCHPNGGGLSLTTYDNVLDGGNDGMVITVYDQNSSVLYDRITRQESENGDMPPAGSLSQNQIAIIGQWISEGALPYEVDHSNMAYGDDIYQRMPIGIGISNGSSPSGSINSSNASLSCFVINCTIRIHNTAAITKSSCSPSFAA